MQTGGRTFKHLTKNDRLRIEKWQRRGLKPPQIAEKLRVHVSTIYRELKRGEYERLDGATWGNGDGVQPGHRGSAVSGTLAGERA